MKHFKFAILISIILICVVSCGSKKNATKNEETNTQIFNKAISSNLSYLQKLDGKYPHEVGLFNNSNLKQRLKKLIGDENYKFLIEKWAVESPIEVKNNIFISSACEAHNCYGTNFILLVNLNDNAMFAGIRNNGKVSVYSEDKSASAEITKWANENK